METTTAARNTASIGLADLVLGCLKSGRGTSITEIRGTVGVAYSAKQITDSLRGLVKRGKAQKLLPNTYALAPGQPELGGPVAAKPFPAPEKRQLAAVAKVVATPAPVPMGVVAAAVQAMKAARKPKAAKVAKPRAERQVQLKMGRAQYDAVVNALNTVALEGAALEGLLTMRGAVDYTETLAQAKKARALKRAERRAAPQA